jgi:hypothetical protein
VHFAQEYVEFAQVPAIPIEFTIFLEFNARPRIPTGPRSRSRTDSAVLGSCGHTLISHHGPSSAAILHHDPAVPVPVPHRLRIKVPQSRSFADFASWSRSPAVPAQHRFRITVPRSRTWAPISHHGPAVFFPMPMLFYWLIVDIVPEYAKNA